MPKKLTDLQQYLVDEFVEDYQHGQLSRRDALQRIVAVTGSATMAAAIMAACGAAPTVTPAAPATATAAPGAARPSIAVSTPVGAAPGTATAASGAATAAAPATPTSSTATRVATSIATRAAVMTTATLAVTPTPGAGGSLSVPANDPAVEAMDVSFPAQGVTVLGYLARPKGAGGALIPILVCHENRGLTEHIKDVARRLGKAGYLALAVDLLSQQGGTAKVADQAQIPGVLGNTPADQFVGYFKAAITYLQGQPNVAKEKFGMTGFCFGGGITWRTISKAPEIKAAVPYYGPNPPLEDVPDIQAAVLAMYGETDARINAGIPAIEAAMKQSNKVFEKMIYPGAGHAFNNDSGANYNEAAARDAWSKTLAWFAKYLKA